MSTQLRGPGDLNSEGGSSSSTYPRDLEEKHKILINRRTPAGRTCMPAETYEGRQPTPAPVRSARISPRASGAPPSAIPSGSGQDGPALVGPSHRTSALVVRWPDRCAHDALPSS